MKLDSRALPRPLRTLHGRLAAVLLLLLLAVGTLGLVATQVTARWHREEASQAVNLDLASSIAASEHGRLIAEDGTVHREELAKIFHWMMVINPGAQFYLLDEKGTVLAYDQMPGPIVQETVDLEPIRRLLEPEPSLPIKGDDPRDPSRRKIFSVAPLEDTDGRPGDRGYRGYRGFLYIVLDNRPFETLLESLRSSYILQMGLLSIVLSLVAATFFGVLFFKRLTRPLQRLSSQMRSFRDGRPSPIDTTPQVEDEISELQASFERMVQRQREQRTEIERLARQRSELIANVSHDLRTPISMVQGYLETLREKSLEPAERQQYLDIAWKQSARLAKLVGELFELTKLDGDEVEVRRESFSLAELVQDNAMHFEKLAHERGIELETSIDRDVPSVEADIGLVERALQNLIENALRFTAAGGRVELGARRIVRPGEPQQVEVFVSDTGCGIAEDELDGIFERYFRAKDSQRGRGGSGLGLAITRKIIDLHGGTIAVESRPGEGSTFRIRLPARRRVAAAPWPLERLA